MQCTLWLPGVRAGGEGACLTNTGVLVARVRTPFPPSVGSWSCVRIGVPSDPFTSEGTGNGCGSQARRLWFGRSALTQVSTKELNAKF